MSGADDIRARFAEAETVPPAEGAGPVPRTPDGGDTGGQGGPPVSPSEEGAKLPLNDTGNGRRFALYFGDQAMVVPRVGWHAWDGRRWARDPDDIAVRRMAQAVQTRITEEIPHLKLPRKERQLAASKDELMRELEGLGGETEGDRDRASEIRDQLAAIEDALWARGSTRARHAAWAKSSGNSAAIKNMLTEATVELVCDIDDLDADPLTINTESGLLRFTVEDFREDGGGMVADVELLPHTRTVPVEGREAPQLITKLIPVAYDPEAKCPRFDAFLERVQPNPALRGFLQRWLGLSMTGLTVQKFAFFYGHGANGKSVLVDLVARIMGDYGATAKVESLTGRNRRGGGDATPDLIPLVGARMVRASEPEEGERLLEGMIKELTGGEPILVRQLHADFIEVRPIFKLTMSGNYKPDIRGTDDGIWRRVMLVPFDVQIPPDERDEKLGEKLWAERAGIFNWLVDGLIQVLEGGLMEPAEVLEATKEYREDSDPIGAYLRECCLVSGDPVDFVTSRELMDGFNLFLDQKGEGMWGPRTVSLKLKALAGRYRDPVTGKTYSPGKQKVNGYRGIRFQDMFKKAIDEAPRDRNGHPVAYTSRSGDGEVPT